MPTMQLTKTSPISPVASELNASATDGVTATTATAKAASPTASAPSVSAYVSASFLKKTAFIVCLLVATVFRRSLALLAGAFETLFGKVEAGGEELIPEKGSFVLVVNHFHGAWTPFVTAAVLAALKRRRADAVDDLAMVIGQRAETKKKRIFIARWVRSIVMWVLEKWQHNVLRIPLGNTNVSVGSLEALRAWKRVATERPTLVFPEGLASITFEKVRTGAGQFVRALGVPVVPCAVWYHQGQWHVEFDAPIAWAKSPELSDLQVGLSIARLLPADLTPSWQRLLERWQSAHNTASV